MTTLSICLILVMGPFSITPQEIPTLMSVVNTKLSEANITLNVKKIETKPLTKRVKYTVQNLKYEQHILYNNYKAYVARNKKRYSGCQVHVILPPMIPEGSTNKYIGEVASTYSACRGIGFSVSNALSPFFKTSAMLMIHGLFHTRGARHIERLANIMMPSFAKIADVLGLPILKETKEQLCL